MIIRINDYINGLFINEVRREKIIYYYFFETNLIFNSLFDQINLFFNMKL